MKITKVTPWLVSLPRVYLGTANDNKVAGNREYLFVEVSIDEGITGVGLQQNGTVSVRERSG